ncbi:MAG: hypothetical protein A3D96_00790 [Chlamydiae bacterium RIFCSPHIGHO2_12_FULL_44_59]|nr:MAG: hypothetical protein A2796_00235 [Chlamydiae bacterium RIFCSPHIGHO2_01_FULL_44_39]OGN59984.1 MAG: hypothetical protein A3D96_00790 [Chlamydiae bacterium RIFCSPHIGHO2_12_FULL_44_59]OGN66199.1 MAG: hypothetical protein A2978_06115 [Chlamydiae bacterium RIFCSPLOWO2_01_FULL_44_52]OGN69103.1 MAG: hypothetical protein A3I67_07600 [Chlamydiae bacterium RIFCSPLOWO2_02_FULL_45_22]OGN69875.1 MAG: hypothetical protein A3F79_04410 [Chlamydiae bacterium RIFCSPLOWO2_12_FULL_45_20]
MTQASTRRTFTFLSIYLTFFVDSLAWAVVFPIFAPYFLDTKSPLFSPETAAGTRSMVLGFFLMAFSLGQFIGCPLIGEYADKHGRKKALGISVFFTLVGLAATALSIENNHLYFLFVSRLITGIFASNTTVCLSCISDLSHTEHAKAKHFGTLSMIAGISFVIGAFLGGKLSDKTISLNFSPSLPLWLAAALTSMNFLFILFGFRETASTHPSLRFHFLEAFTHIKLALKTHRIKRIYTVYFLFLFSWTILFQFIPVLTVEKFFYTSSNIGDLALFMGLCWAIGSGYINQALLHRIDSGLVLELCLIGFTTSCALVVFPSHVYGVIGLVGLCVVIGAVAWPICTSLISNMAPKEMQGKVMGLSQSVQSLAMTLAPAIGGIAFQSSSHLPFFIAASVSFLAVVIYYFVLKQR